MRQIRQGAEAAGRAPSVIDRMSDLLEFLEKHPGGAGIRELSRSLAQPRSSVYRSLNSLEAHGIVRRSAEGAYKLGPRLLALAAQVVVEPAEQHLVEFGQPCLNRVSVVTGEASKLSVLTGDRALVIAVAQGGGSIGVAVRVLAGTSYPIHAGAASKLLLAYLPPEEQEALLTQPLHRLTRSTVTDRQALSAELAAIRARGYAADRGEFAASVHALATPVHDHSGRVVAALSIPFLADADARRRVRLRAALRDGARHLSAALAAMRQAWRPAA